MESHSAKSNCKEIDTEIPKTGDIEYLQNPRNHSARTVSAFFTDDALALEGVGRVHAREDHAL
jgi:hypothetical protein